MLAIHTLGEADLPGLLALTRAAHWNQDEADWRTMLATGYGWGIADERGALLASTVVLPYDTVPESRPFAWISMVLVRPDARRRGFASRLLREALADLARAQRLPILDATPAGREVYRQEGFVDRWAFERLARAAGASADGPASTDASRSTVDAPSADVASADDVARTADVPRSADRACRPLCDADWPAIAALDARAFGGDRTALLRSLAQRLPAVACVAHEGGALRGFVLGRPGHDASQIGPLVAVDEPTALALLARALRAVGEAPVYVDVPMHQPRVRAALAKAGFVHQRPFTRMLHLPPGDATPAPGDAALVMLVAGPELG